jgi:hypothetical protein
MDPFSRLLGGEAGVDGGWLGSTPNAGLALSLAAMLAGKRPLERLLARRRRLAPAGPGAEWLERARRAQARRV